MTSKIKPKKSSIEGVTDNFVKLDEIIEIPEIYPEREIAKPLKPTESQIEIAGYNKLINEYHTNSFSNISNMNQYVDQALKSDAIKFTLPNELYQSSTRSNVE